VKHPNPLQWLSLLAGLIWASMVLAQAPAVIDSTLSPWERSRALVAYAGRLVDAAYSGKTHATAYRIDVAHYRESLRELVRENDARPPAERLPAGLLLDMVRMAALLQSAAQCQTGRYIVCPPDLMSQLQRQQAVLDQGIAALAGQP
jgi:hypothetical protein